MKFDKDDATALTVTIISHLILLALLYLIVMRTMSPNEDSGILVNFGDVAASTGINEPQYTERTAQKEVPPPAAPKTTPTAEKELITQNEEESVNIPDKKAKKKNEVADNRAKIAEERKRKEEEERKRKEKEQSQQQEAISNRVANSFGMGASTQSQQGDAATGKGNQGNPFGNADTGANEGSGGFGTFDLNGRSIGSGGLPRPQYNGQQEGRIVISITVDPNGNVVRTEIGKGTNIDVPAMRQSALDAAKRAKFNKIQGGNNQTGTITYIYKLN